MSPKPKPPTCPHCKPAVKMAPFAARTTRAELIGGFVCPGCEYRKITVRARGIVCGRCGSPRMPVRSTEDRRVKGAIFRYRRCPGCGWRTKTREVEVPYVQPPPQSTPTESALARVAV
jgi:hypothetical protein